MSPAEKTAALVQALAPLISRCRTDKTAIRGPNGPVWTTERLTVERMERHVNGGPARGVCPIKAGEDVTRVAVLDFDSHRGESSWAEMVDAASMVADALKLHGYEPVSFRSGGGNGIHTYLVWDTPQDAYSVRQALGAVLRSVGFKDGTLGGVKAGNVEVFPRQDSVPADGYGNQFFLPLAGLSEPIDLELGILMGRDAAHTLVWPASTPVPELDRPERKNVLPTEGVESTTKIAAALAAIPNDGVHPNTPDYFGYRDILYAVHEATGGSEEGFAAAMVWSEQNPLHDEALARQKIWEYTKNAGEKSSGAITRATLFKIAGDNGWGKSVISAEGFDEVDTVTDPSRDLPPFVRHRNGSILATIGNLLMALRRPDVCGWLVGRDSFRDELMRSTDNGKTWQAMADEDMVLMREFLERQADGFAPIAKETMRDAVGTVALQHRFDSAQLWLRSLPPWDGTRRITRFTAEYAGTADTPYTRAVGHYLWTALAGRVLQPGVKADMVPVLVGKQGVRKSSLVAAMVPDPMHHAELSLDEKEDDLARKMRGRLVGEFGELMGLRKKEVEALKSFVTRTHENWVPKFKELPTTYPRRIVFVGTTNAEEFLTDETGNRRWLPVRVETRCDPDKMRENLEQLWAEGATMFLEHGVMWQDAENLARGEVDAFLEIDAWGPPIEAWLRRVARSDPSGMSLEFDASRGFTSHDVASMALSFHARDINRATESRIGRVLANLACPKERVRRDGVRVYVYQLPAIFTATGGVTA